MTRWEYKTVYYRAADGAMTALGNDGWELAGAFWDGYRATCIFKRPLPDKQGEGA